MRNKQIALRVLSLTMAAALAAFGQATATGLLAGRVTDTTDAVIPNVTVKITNTTTGAVREAVTNAEGLYQFSFLTAGTYEGSVTQPGFSTAAVKGLLVQVGQTTTVNIVLKPGQQAETVTVSAEYATLLDTAKSDVSLNITPGEVRELPLNGRDFANLAFLAPGAKPVNSYDPTKNRISIFGINGSAGRNVNVTVNGIDNKDNTVGGPVMQFPLEAIQEFVISTQRFSAANGRSEGAAVNVITRTGTNQMHGALYLFARDTSLTANDYFSKAGGQTTPPISRQQYGGSFGTPIVKDRTFAFFALERQREETSIGVTDQAFNELTLAAGLGAKPARVIGTPYRDQRYNGRLDHKINDKHQFFLSYSSQGNRGLNDQSSQTNDLTAGNFTTNELLLANFTLNSVLSPRVVNAFTAGHQYWNNLIDSDSKVPNLAFPNGIYFGTNTNVPQQSFQRKWQFRDDLSITVGKHALKTGFDYVKIPKLGGFFQTPATLNITFQDLPSKITTDKVTYPNGFATPGAITGMSASSGNPYFLGQDAAMFGLYFQDDWKVSRDFSLNLGMRWDVDLNLQGGNVQARSRTYLALKQINSPWGARLPRNDKNNFSPRLGFAWNVGGDSKFVVRGGWGMYFGQTFQNIPLFMEQQANDTVFTQTLSLASAGFGDNNSDIVPGTGGRRLSQFRYGVDPLPPIPAASTSLTAGAVGRLVDPDFQNPYNHQFNLGVAWQLDSSNVIEVEGIHVLGLREAKRQNINPLRPSVGNTRPLDAAFTAAGLPRLAPVIVESSIGRSRYDALNISYRRRMAKRFSLNTNYVYSAAKAYIGGPAAFGNVAMYADNVFNPGDFGYAPNDERHHWVFSGVLDMPWGIKVAPIMQFGSARPYNLVQGVNWIGNGAGNGAARAVVFANDPTDYKATINLSAAAIRTGVADGSLKVINYNTARGQEFYQFDLRVSKTFKVAERHSLEFISQFFNLTNRANFGGNYVGNIRSSTFGQPNGFITPSALVVPKSFAAELAVQYRF